MLLISTLLLYVEEVLFRIRLMFLQLLLRLLLNDDTAIRRGMSSNDDDDDGDEEEEELRIEDSDDTREESMLSDVVADELPFEFSFRRGSPPNAPYFGSSCSPDDCS